MSIAPLDDISGEISLRSELILRAQTFALTRQLSYQRTDGPIPGIIFGCDAEGRHGNFHPSSYRQISERLEWARRLNKIHTAYKRAWLRSDWEWKELDCATSSDALLMNIFCHSPGKENLAMQGMLGIEANTIAVFGFKPRTPLKNGRGDNTEIDMKYGDLLVEAKLTESDFQSSRPELVTRYRDFETVFEVSDLPVRYGRLRSYQLIRGTLAAYANHFGFCVLCDSRRPELIEDWYQIMHAVQLVELRPQLKVLTWQELASVLPEDLQHFLSEKYGIFPTT
jgi:hypothetical protein